MIQILIFNKYINDASNPHNAKAQLSHINIFAGKILKNINDAKTAQTITTNVVEMYVPDTKVITANTINSTHINHQTNQSSPSVMFIAFTIAIVNMNVKIGRNIQM